MVLVAGGTGRLGTAVVELLTKRGMHVRVLTRDRAKAKHLPESVEVAIGDVREPSTLAATTAGVTTVVSAVQGLDDRKSSPEATDRDGNRNLIDAAKAAGVEHFVLVSVLGASRDHPMSINRAKHVAEQYLKQGGLAWTIVRPTAYMEFWAQLVGKPLIDTGKTQVFGRGDNPINFVSVRDVAMAIEKAIVDPGMRGLELDMGGPENLTLNQVVEIFEQAGRAQGALVKTGQRAKVSHMPLPVMKMMSVLMRPINPALARIAQAGVVMDTTHMTWDGSANRARYPWLAQTPLIEVIKEGQKRKLERGD